MFFEQLSRACELHDTSVTAVAAKLGISKSNVTNWKNGTMPNSDVVVRLSELLDVSTDYLLLGKEETAISNSNVGAVGNNSNGVVTINESAASSQKGSTDEINSEVLRILCELPLRERLKLVTMIYEFEDDYKKRIVK